MHWRIIDEFPNYEVSCTGLVRSRVTGIGMSPTLAGQGYPSVLLSAGTKKSVRRRYVHRLVTIAFIGPLGHGHARQVNHKDGVKTNNNVGNLEIVSSAENHRHARALGLYPVGERHVYARLTDEKVRIIRGLRHSSRMTQRQMAELFAVSQATICHVLRGHIWKHV
jgi:hypothetical protein